tara:strand:- start:2447 stop:3865 length:1419 start_codon:yes stop_codon:yes gene_type:complete
MANELDKTIEELEAEVLAELEEAAHDAPKKNAGPSDPMVAAPKDGATNVEKGAKPAEVGSASVAAGKSGKEITNDPAQKGEVPAEPQPKLKEKKDKKEGMHDLNKEGMHKMEKVHKEGAHDDEESKKDDEDEDQDEAMHKEMDHGKMKEDMMKAMKSMKKDDMVELYATYMKNAMNMTKDEMYKEMMNGMDKMTKGKMEKLHAAYHSEMGHEGDDEKDAKTEERLASVNVKEHVDALLSSDSNLSEEFKVKAATIFETAVKSKIREEIKRLEEEFQTELRTEVADVHETLTNKVDNYLNYVVEEWMKENELALERGLKGEIAEDFISGLKTLFEDHYIDVPDEKYDVLEAQAEKISKLEEKLEKTIQEVVDAKNSNGSLIKEKVLKDVTSDLTDTEIEKFESLAQDVEYTEEGVYTEKLNTLKESYFPKQKVQTETHDEVETGTAVEDLNEDSSIAAYMSAIGRTVKSANNK